MTLCVSWLPLPFQGITVEVGRAHFETETTRFTILDAPVTFYPQFFLWFTLYSGRKGMSIK